jgi:hypothetical protein
MQLGLLVSKVHTHVPKMSDVEAIMSLQDVWAGCAFNAYKICGQTAIVWL